MNKKATIEKLIHTSNLLREIGEYTHAGTLVEVITFLEVNKTSPISSTELPGSMEKSWKIVRIIREESEVNGTSRADALNRLNDEGFDPAKVTIVRETCVQVFP